MIQLVIDIFSVLFSRNFYKLKSYVRCFRRLFQRWKYGFDDSDMWNLDFTIAELIASRLKMFRKRNECHPSSMTFEEWNGILDKMIYGFENYDEASDESKEAFELLSKHYMHLWE